MNDKIFYRSARKGACLIWQGSRGGNGYGTVRRNKAYIYVHRLAWEATYGHIPNGLFVMHKCDVPLCIEPTHLMLGTNADNLRDASAKGRIPNGERRENSILTESAVKEMRERYAAGGIGLESLGKKYGVCFSVARRVIRRETWGHVA